MSPDALEGRFPVAASGSWRPAPVGGGLILELAGEAVALVDANGERTTLPLGALEGVDWDAGVLTLVFDTGTLDLRGEGRLAAAARAIAARACAPGELTLALRTFGSHRRGAGGGAGETHRRYFDPLLAARKKLAKTSEPRAQTAALDARALRASYEDFAHAVGERSGGLSRADRRALEAQLDEAIEPLLLALRALEDRASALRTSGPERNVAAWRDWAREAAAAFAAADRCWPAVARLLAGWRPGPRPSLWRRMLGRAR